MNALVSTNLAAVRPDRLPPPHRGDGPVRLLVLSSDALGWATSRQQLIRATADRADVIACHVLLRRPLWMRLANRPWPGRRIGHVLHPAATWRHVIARWLRGPLDGRRFDVVHANPQSVGLAAADAKAHCGFALSVACDTTERQFRRDRGLADTPGDSGDAAVFAAADLVAPWSRWCADSLAGDYGVDPARILVTPPAVHVPTTTAERPPADRPLRIAFVGNDFERKGGPRLLKWHQSRWAARGVELHVTSADAADHPALPGVTFHGRLDHARVLALLADCDVLVHPTTADMSAVVVVEAQTLGVPAVASRVGGIGDLIDDGVSGYLIDPADDAGFVAATERVLFEPARRAAMSVAARAFAARTLTADVIYGRLLDRIVALAA